MAELETFKDILSGQVDTLQKYFDACAENNTPLDHLTSAGGDICKRMCYKLFFFSHLYTSNFLIK